MVTNQQGEELEKFLNWFTRNYSTFRGLLIENETDEVTDTYAVVMDYKDYLEDEKNQNQSIR